jgi:hypothetical protein
MQELPTEDKQTWEVVYRDKVINLTFSNIVQIVPPEDALERFVVEWAQAMGVIRDLREIQKNESDQITIQELDQILFNVTTAMKNWYSPIRAYSIECAKIKENLGNLATITPKIQAQIRFEEYIGSIGREFGSPITMLIGSWELIRQEPDNQDLRKTLLDRIDQIVIKLFEFIEEIKSYQRGEPVWTHQENCKD